MAALRSNVIYAPTQKEFEEQLRLYLQDGEQAQTPEDRVTAYGQISLDLRTVAVLYERAMRNPEKIDIEVLAAALDQLNDVIDCVQNYLSPNEAKRVINNLNDMLDYFEDLLKEAAEKENPPPQD